MAITLCDKEITMNIHSGCESNLVKGYESLAFLISLKDFNLATKTYASGDNRILKTFTPTSGKIIGVINAPENAFEGTNTELNADNPYGGRFTKNFAFHIPMMGAGVGKDVVEPLFSGAPFVAFVEKKDKKGDGTFEVIGTVTGLRITSGSRDVVSNGFWEVVLTEEASNFAEVVLFDTDYATSKAKFDALKGLTP